MGDAYQTRTGRNLKSQRFPLCRFVILVALASTCFAELPDFYKNISCVVWVVKSIDKPLQGWRSLGLSDIHDYGNITFKGRYHEQPVSGAARVISGNLGNLRVEMIEPTQGDNAFTEFLSTHGDGIFAIAHETTPKEIAKEIGRMNSLGVGVLQQLTIEETRGPVTFTFFDTASKGKYVLALVHWEGGAPPAGIPGKVSHIAFVARESESVSAFWEKLGFPAMPKSHASPREDSRYHGKPLLLPFDVCWQRHTQFTYEWIIPPLSPPNLYADFLKIHGEGVQHLGLPVNDLAEAISEYKRLGYPVAQSGAWGETGKKGSGQYAYMETDLIGGITVELIHAIK